ncbi:FAM65C isoform X1 [Pelobates cultripes]|uniref:FAM65C isoform X1 n=1 Tax=Pelobates cultripes TaxID=61616 RepID=A0AAD1SKG9_PELCU|nr:FAM65C isoform X1 [Pelobates cultripes]
MSVKLRFSSPSDGLGGVGRSRSFAGFSTLQIRKSSQSLSRSSVRSKLSVKSEKLYPSLRKGSIRLDPHPHQVKKIFDALRKGLNDYLEEHQTQLEFLASQQKDIKRNSRLAYFYDLDKEIRLIERHIRKLEFHISKIEELYETYCVQWRLRVGACNMKHAFSLSPSTKASRESLVELFKNFQECTEDMCMIEGALEVHLGEFFIKMKGLVGYARLCPGDHYEVLIRLGRQRWRLKGKIESDDSQIWDEEEKLFIPNLCENFEIKAMDGQTPTRTRYKVQGWGECQDQSAPLVVVMLPELAGYLHYCVTSKLEYEVLWFPTSERPFDNNKILSTPGTTSKFSTSPRKASLYHWTPPNTPNSKEKLYLSVLQQGDLDNPYPSLDKDIHTPYILSYLANSELVINRRNLGPNGKVNSVDNMRSIDNDGNESQSHIMSSSCGEIIQYSSSQELFRMENKPDSVTQPSSHETLDILRETPSHYGPHQAMKHTSVDFDLDTSMGSIGDSLMNVSLQEEAVEPNKDLIISKGNNLKHSLQQLLEEVLELLKSDVVRRSKLKDMEKTILTFKERLKGTLAHHPHSSMDSLMVETALQSFAFLNTDFHADEMSMFGSLRNPSKSNGTIQDGGIPSIVCATKLVLSELTTGNDELDTLLSIHLQVCRALLKKLVSPVTARITHNHVLEELLWQKEVFDDLVLIYIQKAEDHVSIEDIFPKTKKIRHFLKLWRHCTESHCIWFCSTEIFLNRVKKMFVPRIKGKNPGLLEQVLLKALEQIHGFGGILPANQVSEEFLSIFLVYGYLRRYRVMDLQKHLAALTREVTLIDDLQLPGRLKKIKKLKTKQISRLQPLPQFLQLLATFQLDENVKLCKAAASCLTRGSAFKTFKQKAVLYYTEVLTERDSKLQQAACLALKHLKGTASIDQIACLCQSEVDEVRHIARETILSFGQKGRQVFRRTDKICRELQDTLTVDGEIEITVF